MATPTTVNTWPLNGSIQEFDVTFDYLSQTFIKVNLIGPTGLTLLTLGSDYTFVTPTRIRTVLVYGPPNFTTIEIRRETSTTERLVEFQDASILHAQDLNVDALQVMHVAEEARNAATETLGVNGDGNLDARSRRIVNVLDPVDPADVVTLNYYTSQVNGVHTDRLAAEAARDKAQEWAIKPTAVEGTDQSAKTYAAQAGVSAGVAMTQAGVATTQAGLAVTARSGAETARGGAETARTGAEAARDAASTSAGTATTQANTATTQAGIATTQAGIATTKAAEAAASAQSVDSAYLNGQLANNTVAQSLHGGQLAHSRNVIHNGAFDVWQKGLGPYTISNSADQFFVDRFAIGRNGSGPATLAAITDAPTSEAVLLGAANITASGVHSLGASDFLYIAQRIEGYNARKIRGRTFTLSFWVKASRTGTYSVAFRNNGATSSWVSPYTVNVAGVWQKVVVTVAGGIPVGSAFTEWGSNRAVEVMWPINAGDTLRTGTVGTWVSANVVAPTGGANGLVAINDYFRITGVQLEQGTLATSFEYKPYSEQLIDCLRYYETGRLSAACDGVMAYVGSSTAFRVLKRTGAPVTVYSSDGGGNGGPGNNRCSVDAITNVNALVGVGNNSIICRVNNVVFGVDSFVNWHWVASSEI